ncbi:MAG: type IV pilin [Salinigranum sp.]
MRYERGSDGRAVSPVIGVVLMITVTVILAAVVGAFALGLADQQSVPPQVSLRFTYDAGAKTVTITHRGGDPVDAANLSIRDSATGPGNSDAQVTASGRLTAGSAVASGEPYDPGETIRVVWTDPKTGDTSVLARSTAP